MNFHSEICISDSSAYHSSVEHERFNKSVVRSAEHSVVFGFTHRTHRICARINHNRFGISLNNHTDCTRKNCFHKIVNLCVDIRFNIRNVFVGKFARCFERFHFFFFRFHKICHNLDHNFIFAESVYEIKLCAPFVNFYFSADDVKTCVHSQFIVKQSNI